MMTKERATRKVERCQERVNDAKEDFDYWFGLVDDMEQNGEPCEFEKERLAEAMEELEYANSLLEDAIDLRDNWC